MIGTPVGLHGRHEVSIGLNSTVRISVFPYPHGDTRGNFILRLFGAHFAPRATFLPLRLGFMFDRRRHVASYDGGLMLLGKHFGPNT